MGYEWTYTCACKRAPGVCGGVVVGFDLAETGMEDPGAEVRVEEKDPFGFGKFLDRLAPVKKEADGPVAAGKDSDKGIWFKGIWAPFDKPNGAR